MAFKWVERLNRIHALLVVAVTAIFILGATSSNIQSQISSLQSENEARKLEQVNQKQDIKKVLERLDQADSQTAIIQTDIKWIRHYLEK